MENSGHIVRLERFEGPLDLLLNLIEKRKLFINDISLSKVADDFINYVKELGQFPIAESAHFILVASTLLLIKSKSLLPNLELTSEEGESIHDLEERLKLYQRIKELGVHIKDRFGKKIIFERNQSREIVPVFSPDPSMTVPSLFSAIRDVLAHIPKTEALPQVLVKKVISLEEMIESLTKRVQSSLRMSFKDFANTDKAEKVTVIVSFLAMLELVRIGMIAVSQEQGFGDIQMETNTIGVPHY